MIIEELQNGTGFDSQIVLCLCDVIAAVMDGVEIVDGVNDTNVTSSNFSDWNPDGDYELGKVEYYSTLYKAVAFSLFLVVFVVGVVGNFAVIVCVLRSKALQTTTYVHLVSLAVADIILLLVACPQRLISQFFFIDEWVLGEVGCVLSVFLSYLGFNVSSLSITVFTVERYIAICYPFEATHLCTMSRARRTAIAVWVFGIVYCSPWLYLAVLVPLERMSPDSQVVTVKYCISRFPKKSNIYNVFYAFDFTIFYVLPLVLSIVLYTLMSRVLMRSSHLQQQQLTSQRCSDASQPTVTSARGTTESTKRVAKARQNAQVSFRSILFKAFLPTQLPELHSDN